MALEKALITNRDTGDDISVLFNPEEYSLSQDNNFAQQTIPGLRSPLLQFTNGNLRSLTMELLFDTRESHRLGSAVVNRVGDDVRDLTKKITGLMEINSDTHAPPVLVITWASLSFTCVLQSASQNFILFAGDGTPLRAKLSCTFNEFIDVEREAKEINRQTSDLTKVHIVIQGENLNRIATIHYENAQSWRPIAVANGLSDPRGISPGMELAIPSLPYYDPESGQEIY